MDNERYPKLTIDLKKLRHNMEEMVNLCSEKGIAVAGVIKGFNGIPKCAKQMAEAGCEYIASSRLEQLEAAKKIGITTPLMLIRIPMLSELDRVVALTDLSLQSEIEVMIALNKEAERQGKIHKVILMADLGDLREGFWYKEELKAAALEVENNLKNVELAGIGTNLGCYGSIEVTTEKMDELVAIAEEIETKIGRQLKYISGGATTSLPLVFDGNMNKRINLLRIGEGVILAKDLQDIWGYDMDFMYQDAFTLKAEVIEVKSKPSHPVGKISVDAFGHTPVYEDRGIRKRALLAMGRVDYGDPMELVSKEEGIEIIGASSDHTIIDIENAKRQFKVGDVIEFRLCYATIIYVTNSKNIHKVFIE